MTNQKKRTRLQILKEIVDVAKGGSKKTNIMYKCNLSFDQLNKYLNLALDRNLIGITSVNPHPVYTVTSKGLQFSKDYEELMKSFNS